MSDRIVRRASDADRDAVRALLLAAFPAAEREQVAVLAANLLCQQSDPATHSLVADAGDDIAGYVAFSPVYCEGTYMNGYILAPLAVHPQQQKKGMGGKLIEAGLKQLSALSTDIVFVYGDPNYYGRFGFNADDASGYTPVYSLEYPFGWLARKLHDDFAMTPATLDFVPALQKQELW